MVLYIFIFLLNKEYIFFNLKKKSITVSILALFLVEKQSTKRSLGKNLE